MDEEPIESLWVRIKGNAGEGDVTVGVCYRLPDQDDRPNEAFYRQIGATLHSLALDLMGDFSHPNICWRDNTAGHKQSKKFLECINDSFLLQVVEEPIRRGTMLDLVLTNKEGLNDKEVRLSHDLSKGEINATKKRREKVLMFLKNLGISCGQNDVPNIVVLGSGRGLHAMIALLRTLVELKKQNILDAVMYLCRVSGSTWCMSLLDKDRKWSENLMGLEEELCENLSKSDIMKAEGYLLESSEDELHSLTDFWDCFRVYQILKQFDENELADHKEASETGINSYPIYAAVDKDKLSEEGQNCPGTWFEFTPHEAGYTTLGAFVSTKNFGSEFEEGKVKKDGKKKTICYTQGLGTAIGSMEENLKFIQESNSDTFRDYEPTLLLLDLQLCAVSGSDPKEVFKKLLTILSHLDFLIFKKPIMNSGLQVTTVRDRANVQPPYLVKTKIISLIDAGLAINSAYPLVLREQQRADLIISFDFGAGDPFETITRTATYCQTNHIPFPKTEDQKMDKSHFPCDCYVFRGDKSCPTVMHFPLFNKVNCSGNMYSMQLCHCIFVFHILSFQCHVFQSPSLLSTAAVNGHRRKGTGQAQCIMDRN
ncbi:LOW QUALITY PROTEIN: cytosolic phospholipase A2 gamma [Alca torda]